MKNRKIKQIIILALGFVVLFFLIFYPKISRQESYTAFNNHSDKPNPFEDLNLEAKAAYVFDLTTNKPIFSLHENTQLPLASLTKIMTVVVAREITTKDISKLIDAALMQSSNEAASALASMDNNFINLMNQKAKELELNQTYFLNETGLDVSENLAGGYGSASDIVKLMRYALKNNPHLFEATTLNSTLNTNPYATTTPELIASKTGFTDLAGGNLAVVFDAGFNHPIAAVVLGSSKEGRFIDVQKLIEATFKK